MLAGSVAAFGLLFDVDVDGAPDDAAVRPPRRRPEDRPLNRKR